MTNETLFTKYLELQEKIRDMEKEMDAMRQLIESRLPFRTTPITWYRDPKTGQIKSTDDDKEKDNN